MQRSEIVHRENTVRSSRLVIVIVRKAPLLSACLGASRQFVVDALKSPCTMLPGHGVPELCLRDRVRGGDHAEHVSAPPSCRTVFAGRTCNRTSSAFAWQP
jgi:hypothetical protein